MAHVGWSEERVSLLKKMYADSKSMAQIAAAAQEGVIPLVIDRDTQGETVAESVMQAAVYLARDIKAAALVIPTATGGSVRAAAKWRPRRPIVALCSDAQIAQALADGTGGRQHAGGGEPRHVHD